ncbi:MAG: YbgA family protein [Clostridiaceae bacterium]
MDIFLKPTIFVSKCLGFDNCRYNGQSLKQDFIEKLENHVKIITYCPETGIGLETPRDALRCVDLEGNIKIIQPKTDIDYTEDIKNYSLKIIEDTGEDIDGFILKSRSPTCGIKDVKIYSSKEKGACFKKGSGIFTNQLIEHYKYYPMEDEGRLSNFTIREKYLKSIFTLASFRSIKNKGMEELIRFHNINKMLLMSFSSSGYNRLEKTLKEELDFEEKIKKYEIILKITLLTNAKYTSNLKTIRYALSYFYEMLNEEEKKYIEELLEEYPKNQITLDSILCLIKSYGLRFNIEEITNQTYFQPYPEDLKELRDSGKGL